MSWYGWRPYVPVAVRRRRAMKKMESLRKRGVDVQPIEIRGRKIATTFWGQAWCDHLESFSDYENRLPRGRTYVRNGSVCHLAVGKGKIEAKVSGSEIYDVRIAIKPLAPKKWKGVKQRCAGQIGSLIELLEGRLSRHVMDVVTDRNDGLFPLPREISLSCDCPDWAVMCKHVAAVLYGVGARLDEKPELLFVLRGVQHEELIESDAEAAVASATKGGKSRRLDASHLADVFGIELDGDGSTERSQSPRNARSRKTAAKPAANGRGSKKAAAKAPKAAQKPVKKKPAKKKAVKKKSAPKSR